MVSDGAARSNESGSADGGERSTSAADPQVVPGKRDRERQDVPEEGSAADGDAQAPDVAQSSIGLVISDYLSSIRDITDATNVVMPHLANWLNTQRNDAVARLEATAKAGTIEEDRIHFDTRREVVAYSAARRDMRKIKGKKSFEILTRALFVQIFCEYDAFIGRLLTAIYQARPDLMRGISREISLADLLQFKDIEAACRGLLEKEIETFRRDSYIDQFSALESKFSLKTLRNFPEWKEFVEFCQRRNILVHNDGVVSEQYLAVCKREGVSLPPDTVAGARIGATNKGLARLIGVMSKLGYMLGHTLWSKVFPDQLEQMHQSLHLTIYAYLEDGRWTTAKYLADFALTDPMTKGMKEATRRMIVVNSAIARKFSGDESGAQKILDASDWSAAMPEFRLAVAVLKDDFEGAGQILRKIGKSGEILNQWGYYNWPLFNKFRDREEFYRIYEEIYGEPYREVAEEVPACDEVKVDGPKEALMDGGSACEVRAGSTEGKSAVNEPGVDLEKQD